MDQFYCFIVFVLLSGYIDGTYSFVGQLCHRSSHHSPNVPISNRRKHSRRRRRGRQNLQLLALASTTSSQQDVKKQNNNDNNNNNKRSRENFTRNTSSSTSTRNSNSNSNGTSNNHHHQRRTKTKTMNTMNEFGLLNKQIMQQVTAEGVLDVLAATPGALSLQAGGGAMSTVNFSTAIHRLARHISQYATKDQPGNSRSDILADPRFALLMCSTAEALLDGAAEIHRFDEYKYRSPFEGRNLANIAWAVAKLTIAPPDTVVPVDLDTAEASLRAKSQQLRQQIMTIAKERSSPFVAASSSSSSSSSLWIPSLSELCGIMIDTISVKSLKLDPEEFKQQELSNWMWSLATIQRPNAQAFEFIVNGMVAKAEKIKMRRKNKSNSSSDTKKKNTSERRVDDVLVPVEWSIPLWVIAKSGVELGHEEALLPYVHEMMDDDPDFLERFKPQELSNSVWAAATIISKRPQKGATGEASTAALGILRHTSREMIRRQGKNYKTQELTNHVWSMATLGFGIAADSVHTKKGVAAAIDAGCLLTHSYTHIISDDVDGDRILMESCMAIVLERITTNISPFPLQELNNICWAMTRLQIPKNEEVLHIIGTEISNNPRKRIGTQDVSSTLWSMASMEYYNEPMFRSILARVGRRDLVGYDHFKPQEISNTLWAIASAGIGLEYPNIFDVKLLPINVRGKVSVEEAMISDPVTNLFASGATELILRPDEFKTQEFKDVLWSFSKAGIRHPELFRSMAEYLVGDGNDPKMTGRGLSDFNSQGLANLAYSFARQAQLGGEVLDKYGKRTTISLNGGRLGYFIVINLDIGEALLKKLFAEIARTNLEIHDNLSKCASQDISNTVWAMALLGLKHERYLAAAESTLRSRMEGYIAGERGQLNRLSGQEIVNSFWGMAALNYTPQYGLLTTTENYIMEMFDHKITVSSISRYLNRRELANLCWAVAVFGEYPTKLIEVLYMGLIGVGIREGDDDNDNDNDDTNRPFTADPAYLQKLYDDDGISQVHFNSIVYLQIMMDLELGSKKNPFALPGDFPSAWWTDSSQPSASTSSSSTTNTHGIIELSTSHMQNQVSDAFDRIEFDHVDEYLLTMKDLAENYRIKVAPECTEVISLDIANVGSKLGIEVDGPAHWVSSIDGDTGHMVSSTNSHSPTQRKGNLDYQFNWNAIDQTMNGSTSLKRRMFQKFGWRTISIPFWEWDNTEDNDNKLKSQEDYCRSLLSQQYDDNE